MPQTYYKLLTIKLTGYQLGCIKLSKQTEIDSILFLTVASVMTNRNYQLIHLNNSLFNLSSSRHFSCKFPRIN